MAPKACTRAGNESCGHRERRSYGTHCTLTVTQRACMHTYALAWRPTGGCLACGVADQLACGLLQCVGVRQRAATRPQLHREGPAAQNTGREAGRQAINTLTHGLCVRRHPEKTYTCNLPLSEPAYTCTWCMQHRLLVYQGSSSASSCDAVSQPGGEVAACTLQQVRPQHACSASMHACIAHLSGMPLTPLLMSMLFRISSVPTVTPSCRPDRSGRDGRDERGGHGRRQAGRDERPEAALSSHAQALWARPRAPACPLNAHAHARTRPLPIVVVLTVGGAVSGRSLPRPLASTARVCAPKMPATQPASRGTEAHAHTARC